MVEQGATEESVGTAFPDRRHDGDAAVHLEELVDEAAAPPATGPDRLGPNEPVELVGAHLRLSGRIAIGHHGRLSDFMNHHEGLIELHDVRVLRRNGEPTAVTSASIWVNPTEVTLVGQAEAGEHRGAGPGMVQAKVRHQLIVVTPGHTLIGDIYLNAEAQLAAFIESGYPPYVPMTDVRTRSLADRRVVARYAFALLNRRQIVAATEVQPGMNVARAAV